MTFAILSALAFAFTPAHAGLLDFFEPEALRQDNFNIDPSSWASQIPGGDLDFEYPFDIVKNTLIPALVDGVDEVREDAQLLIQTLLKGANDQDWFMYNKTSTNVTRLIGYPMIFACKKYEDVFPYVVLLGPVNSRDAVTDEVLFPPAQPEQFPFDIPQGYGVNVLTQPVDNNRPIYTEPETNNKYFLPKGFESPCIYNLDDDSDLCDYTNIIDINVNVPGLYYYVVFDPTIGEETRVDVSLAIGTKDEHTLFDALRLSILLPFLKNGGAITGKCENTDKGYESPLAPPPIEA